MALFVYSGKEQTNLLVKDVTVILSFSTGGIRGSRDRGQPKTQS